MEKVQRDAVLLPSRVCQREVEVPIDALLEGITGMCKYFPTKQTCLQIVEIVAKREDGTGTEYVQNFSLSNLALWMIAGYSNSGPSYTRVLMNSKSSQTTVLPGILSEGPLVYVPVNGSRIDNLAELPSYDQCADRLFMPKLFLRNVSPKQWDW